jgi:HAE1 family hydrophobic/amphiphilic exporter-1
MEVDLFGASLDDLMTESRTVMDRLRTVSGLESVDVNIQDASPEIQWRIDRAKAQQLGVSFTDIANALTASTNGTLSSYYIEDGYQFPIYVQVREDQRKTVDQLLALPIQTTIKPPGGGPSPTVRLGDVATPNLDTGPNEITRINRQRYVAVTGRVGGRSEGDVQADIAKTMGSIALPEGMRWDFGTNQRRRAEEFSGMGAAVLLAVALIYMLLASQFESFVYPLVVLTSVPLCAIGVVLALFLTGRAFGLTAFIGLLMLVGIVVKNGILLVDYTNQLRGRGVPRDEAILTAGPTRLRPILMTTCAATLGMLPLALALGRGSETQAPLATAVIGGLSTSTLLTLFVVPVVYTLFDDLIRKMRKDPTDLARSEYVEPSVAAVGPVENPTGGGQ